MLYSLINHPCLYFDLFGKIQANLNSLNNTIKYNLTMINYGSDGATIQDIINIEMKKTIVQNPDAVILYWDSDFRLLY